MTAAGSRDRLWPLLTTLVVLVVGAGAADLLARQRDPAALVVEVGEVSAADPMDDDAGGPSGLGLTEEPTVSEEHAEAKRLAQRGEREKALGLFERVVRSNPNAPTVRTDFAFLLMSAKRPEDAKRQLDEAVRLAPEEPRIALLRGIVLRQMKDLDGALSELSRALSLKPSYSAARVAIAALLCRKSEHQKAIETVEPATRTGDNNERAQAYVLLGKAQIAVGLRERAALAFEQAIIRAPSRADLLVAMANAWLDGGTQDDRRRAVALISRASEMAPDVGDVQVAIGKALERSGDSSGAETAYQRAVQYDAASPYVRRRLLRLAMNRGGFQVARAQAEYLLSAAPDNPEHHFLAGLLSAREGKSDLARKHYQDAIGRSSDGYPEAWLNLGLLEKTAGNLTGAIAAYDKALSYRKDYVAALNNLALAQLASDQKQDAERTLHRAIDTDPRYAPAYLNLGKLLSGSGRTDEAIAALEHGLALRPNSAEARLNLGVAFARAKRFDDAIRTYREIIAGSPKYVSAWYNLALALEASGKANEARDAYQKALGIDKQHVPTLRRLAEIEARSGQASAARRVYEELLDSNPADGSARLALADLERDAGNPAACVRQVELAVASGGIHDPSLLPETRCRIAARQ